jgi:hypothetical protein
LQPKIVGSQADKFGGLTLNFDQELVVPDFVKNRNRRRSLETGDDQLSMINVNRDIISFELLVKSEDESLNDLQYEVYLEEWNPSTVKFFIEF